MASISFSLSSFRLGTRDWRRGVVAVVSGVLFLSAGVVAGVAAEKVGDLDRERAQLDATLYVNEVEAQRQEAQRH